MLAKALEKFIPFDPVISGLEISSVELVIHKRFLHRIFKKILFVIANKPSNISNKKQPNQTKAKQIKTWEQVFLMS